MAGLRVENHILAILGLWLPADVAGANTLRITAYVSSLVVFARRRPVDSRTYPAVQSCRLTSDRAGGRGAESSRWRRSADGGDALSDQSCGMCVGEGAPPVHRVRSGSAVDSLLRHGSVVTVLPWSQVGRPLSRHPCTWAAPLSPGETCPNRHARIIRTPYATSTATGSSGCFHTPWKAHLTSGCKAAVFSAMTSGRHSR